MQPTSITARFNSGSCISEGDKDVFGTMTLIWKLFYYSPKEAETLKGIQEVLVFPELKIMKPRDPGGCHISVVAICKKLPPLLQTHSQLYESSGDPEAYGIYSLLASFMSYQKFLVPLLS